MPKKIDYTKYIGMKYGNLTIQSIEKATYGGMVANCLCDCGNVTKNTAFYGLINNKITMCKSCSGKINGAKGIVSFRNSSKYNYLIGTTVNYFKVLRRATYETDPTAKIGTFVCQCVCGNIRYLDAYGLTKDLTRKSCGCQSGKLLSLAAGGTGIPHEISSINDLIRKTDRYEQWRTACFEAANYTCAISGICGHSLNVHHIISLKTIRDTYNITKENYTEFYDELFDINNGIVLTEELHKKLHITYGKNPTPEQLKEFMASYQ